MNDSGRHVCEVTRAEINRFRSAWPKLDAKVPFHNIGIGLVAWVAVPFGHFVRLINQRSHPNGPFSEGLQTGYPRSLARIKQITRGHSARARVRVTSRHVLIPPGFG